MAIINLTALNRSSVPLNIGAYNLLPQESVSLDLDTSSNVEIWGDLRNNQINNKIVLTINSVSDSSGQPGAVNLNTALSTYNVTIVNTAGTSAVIPPATSTEAGVMSSADKQKLSTIAVGATANSSDIQLRDRSTHTGTQPISSVEGLSSALLAKQDTLISGSNVKTINGNSILGSGSLVIDTFTISSRQLSSASESTISGDQILSNSTSSSIQLTIQQNHINSLEVQQLSAGTVSLVAGNGVTLIGPSLATSGVYQTLKIRKTGINNTFLVSREGGNVVWNNPPTGSQWDNGSTIWDGGSSSWDA